LIRRAEDRPEDAPRRDDAARRVRRRRADERRRQRQRRERREDGGEARPRSEQFLKHVAAEPRRDVQRVEDERREGERGEGRRESGVDPEARRQRSDPERVERVRPAAARLRTLRDEHHARDGDERDEPFEQHAAVADGVRVRLAIELLRRRP
jgi:hypothetical protein